MEKEGEDKVNVIPSQMNEMKESLSSQQRQIDALTKRFKKGKITEKNYLHQFKSIISISPLIK